MAGSNLFTSIVLILLIVILILMVLINRRLGKRPGALSKLASLAFGFIVAGVIFGDHRSVGYSLIGIGIIIAIVDIILKLRGT